MSDAKESRKGMGGMAAALTVLVQAKGVDRVNEELEQKAPDLPIDSGAMSTYDGMSLKNQRRYYSLPVGIRFAPGIYHLASWAIGYSPRWRGQVAGYWVDALLRPLDSIFFPRLKRDEDGDLLFLLGDLTVFRDDGRFKVYRDDSSGRSLFEMLRRRVHYRRC